MVAKLPIIYVRGYAGPESGIDEAVDDAFYGFNAGSTHVRIDGDGEPRYYQFESPLLRLMTDEKYEVMARGSQSRLLDLARDGSLEACARYHGTAVAFEGESGSVLRRKLARRVMHRKVQGPINSTLMVSLCGTTKTRPSPSDHPLLINMYRSGTPSNRRRPVYRNRYEFSSPGSLLPCTPFAKSCRSSLLKRTTAANWWGRAL
jgi:hypothetical protein